MAFDLSGREPPGRGRYRPPAGGVATQQRPDV